MPKYLTRYVGLRGVAVLAGGQTALHWVSLLGDTAGASLLLARGSPLDEVRCAGRGGAPCQCHAALSHAVVGRVFALAIYHLEDFTDFYI